MLAELQTSKARSCAKQKEILSTDRPLIEGCRQVEGLHAMEQPRQSSVLYTGRRKDEEKKAWPGMLG